MSEVTKMNCSMLQGQLHDFLDATLSSAQQSEVQTHLDQCADCRLRLAREQLLRTHLQAWPTAGAERAWQQTLQHIAQQSTRASSGGWKHSILGGAIAASLALGISIGLLWPVAQQSSPVAPLVSTLNGETLQQQTVRLMFASGRDLQGVELTLELPEGVEIANYPSQRSLSWHVDIQAGQNVLTLPLNIKGVELRELVAHLKHGNSTRTFTAAITPTG